MFMGNRCSFLGSNSNAITNSNIPMHKNEEEVNKPLNIIQAHQDAVHQFTEDSIVNSIMTKFVQRSHLGKLKYGKTLDREDLSFPEWIQHVQEELMDAILYLERLKKEGPNMPVTSSHKSGCFTSSLIPTVDSASDGGGVISSNFVKPPLIEYNDMISDLDRSLPLSTSSRCETLPTTSPVRSDIWLTRIGSSQDESDEDYSDMPPLIPCDMTTDMEMDLLPPHPPKPLDEHSSKKWEAFL